MDRRKTKRNSEVRKRISESMKKYIKTESHKKNLSNATKGRKLSNETKRKISLAHKGKPTWNKGKKMSKEFCLKMSKSQRGKPRPNSRGEKSHFWKGGITLLRDSIYNSYKVRLWRSDVFMRDNFTCQECGKRGGYLEAHHIKEFVLILKENNIKILEEALKCEELWNINNGITLCRNCHNKTKWGRATLSKANQQDIYNLGNK